MAWPMSRPKVKISTGTYSSQTKHHGSHTDNNPSDAKKIKTLNMFKDGKARRNAQGEITVAASYQSRDLPTARIEPNRKWFANSRVISQEALTSFRDAVAERAADPYQVLLKTNKLPMSLIRDGEGINGLKQHEAKMAIETAPFNDTFGPKAQRKRVKLGVSSLEDFAGETVRNQDNYSQKNDEGFHADGSAIVRGDDTAAIEDLGLLTTSRESVFSKGQSKRIWNELYKVIDSSDVIIHVLDSRDPNGTRCRSVEKYVREEAPHKHLIFVLNKCDLVPTGVAVSSKTALSPLCCVPFLLLFSFCPPVPSLSQGLFLRLLSCMTSVVLFFSMEFRLLQLWYINAGPHRISL